MKRILVVANLYPSKKDPTFGTFVKNFVDEIGEVMPDVSIEKSVIHGRTSSNLIKLLKYLKFYIVTFTRLMLKRYDLIYVHYISHSIPPVWLVSKLKKMQIAFNIHGDDLLVKSKQGELFLKMAIPLIQSSKLIVVPSSFFAGVLDERIPGIPCSSIFVSPSGGINKSFFNKPEKTTAGAIKLGYVSRIDKGKGWNVFLKAINMLQSDGIAVIAQIIGVGKEVYDMKSMIENLNIAEKVDYIGPVRHAELPVYYQSFDLFIFPTMLPESLGLVGLEAMANGTPVVGSRVGGICSYIKDGENGYLVEPGNVEDLVFVIKKYLSYSEEEKMKIKVAAYNTACQYEAEDIARLLFNRVKSTFQL